MTPRQPISLVRSLGLLLLLLAPAQATAQLRDDAAVRSALEQASRDARLPGENLTGADFRAYWGENDARLVFSIDPKRGEIRFREVDPASGEVRDAFDHPQLAAALAEQSGEACRPERLPLDDLTPEADGSLHFRAFGRMWQWSPATATLGPSTRAPRLLPLLAPNANTRGGREESRRVDVEVSNESAEEIELFWLEPGGGRRSYGRLPAAASRTLSTYSGHVWMLARPAGGDLAKFVSPPGTGRVLYREPVAPERRERNRGRNQDGRSPDGRWQVRVRDHNLFLIPVTGESQSEQPLTREGNARLGYEGPVQWAPDGKHFVAWQRNAPELRRIHIVQNAPEDQLQPKLISHVYPKPGDELSFSKPHLFRITADGAEAVAVDDSLFANPWSIQRLEWTADSSECRFVYNQRGHQVLRLLGISSAGGVRVIHEESSATFIDYSQKFWMHRLSGNRGLLWASERSGHNHILRIDESTGRIAAEITRGPWNVRRVLNVAEEPGGNVELLLETIGSDPQNPYHSHFARVEIPPSGEPRMVRLTDGPAHFRIQASPAGKWLLATGSRPDLPPFVELREAATGRLIARLAEADDQRARSAGWQRPERFTAKGRDGETDIHGLIYRPKDFDPARRYPVVEDIYAGPHDFFVPQSYGSGDGSQSTANLGFVVVKIDGMGTNWRSKAFHDVAWKNLKDSGFPDRIAWIRAAAAERPWMDLSRVGIYGGSAGGQSALAALLHHGDFYHVAVADCGCHDNRMDKVWWNEAWMGWPVDDSYAASSNTTHAAKLRGKLMLIVGELDSNVDPASTAQVAAALQRAGKSFDYVPIFNAGHGAAESAYGRFRRAAFLLAHLRP